MHTHTGLFDYINEVYVMYVYRVLFLYQVNDIFHILTQPLNLTLTETCICTLLDLNIIMICLIYELVRTSEDKLNVPVNVFK